jgi:hypothetical protein
MISHPIKLADPSLSRAFCSFVELLIPQILLN